MLNSASQLEKSRLGRLLVNRGYITETQLNHALQLQRVQGMKLGEILIGQGLLTEKDLQRTLKHQARYRYAAALVAVVVTPLQPMIAMAAAPSVQASMLTSSLHLPETGAKGLQPMDEFELSSVNAQGIQQDVQNLFALVDKEGNPDGVNTLKALAKILFPISDVLDADFSVNGVHYDFDGDGLFTADGGFNIPLPSLIEEVNIENIRVAGSTGPTFGSVYLEGVRFNENASIVIRPN